MEQCLTTNRGKTHGKNFGGPKLGLKFRFLLFASLAFLDITQGCSLGECLTSRRAEASKKKKCGPIRSEMIFSILMPGTHPKPYLDAKHLKNGLNRRWRNFWYPFFQKSTLFDQY